MPRFTLIAVPVEAEKRIIQLSQNGVYLITDDEKGVAESVAREMTKRGHTVALLQNKSEVSSSYENVYNFEQCNLSAISKVVDRIRDRHGSIAGLIHLLPLRERASLEEYDFAGWQKRLNLEVKTVFYLVKSLANDLKQAAIEGDSLLMSATALGGCFGLNGLQKNDFFPGQGGVIGFLKTVDVEWPEVRVKTVDLDVSESITALTLHLLAEISTASGAVEIGYRKNQCFHIGLVEAPLADRKNSEISINSSSIILVTGGARGITAEICLDMAGKYKPQFIIVGRAPLPATDESSLTKDLSTTQELKSALIEEMKKKNEDISLPEIEQKYKALIKEREIRNNLAAMAQAGASVEYVSVDVRDQNAFEKVILNIYKTYDHIDGVIHGAGIIEDKFVEDISPESFDRVFGTKAESIFILSRMLQFQSLQFLVLFSSVAGCFGNSGQSSYTAVNEVVNKFALYLNKFQPCGRVVSINWGPWRTSGMVSGQLERQFAQRGVSLIPPRSGSQMFDMEILRGLSDEVVVVVGDGPWGSVKTISANSP